MTAAGKPWTEREVAFLREHYVDRGATWCAEQLGRTFCSVTKCARRNDILRRRPWTYREDEQLRILWAPHTIPAIAKMLGRSGAAIYSRARDIGLGMGVPQGYECLTHAAERCGYTVTQLCRVLAHGGVRILRGMVRPNPNVRGSRRTHMVEPSDVDDAVAAWCATEPLETAARRLGCTSEVLRRLLLRALKDGDKRIPPLPRRSRLHWRIPSVVVDEFFANYLSLETLKEASARHRLHRRTLLSYLTAGGIEFRRGMKLVPSQVDAILAARGESLADTETVTAAAARHGRSWPFVMQIIEHAIATGALAPKERSPGKAFRLPRATFDALIAAHLAGESGRRTLGPRSTTPSTPARKAA